MATRGNTNGMTSTVSRICSSKRYLSRLVSNIGLLLALVHLR